MGGAGMGGCETFREAISARLDGEEPPVAGAALDAHLAGCAACRDFSDSAALVSRLAGVAALPPFAGVDDSVLDELPAPGGARRSWRARPRRLPVGALRIALGVLGAGQFLLGVAQIAGIAAVEHTHTALAGASPNHLLNESAAWNLAVGAGFAWIALRRSRPNGLVPTLTVFVGVLLLLSAGDLAAGRVETVRLLSHGLLLAGYLVVVALTRTGLDPGEPPAGRREKRWRLSLDAAAEPAAPPALRVLPGGAATARTATVPGQKRAA